MTSGPKVKEVGMPRYRGTREGTASLVGRLLLLVAGGRETSASLAEKLKVSPRQVNRYVLGLVQAGWQIERRGVPTHADYYFELVSPTVVLRERGGRGKGRRENEGE
jgi:hypothetical protein